MAEEYTIVAGPFRPYAPLDAVPVLDEAVLVEALRSVPQVEELSEAGGELVLDTLVFQFDLVRGSDDRLRVLTGEMYYGQDLTEQDLRTGFAFLSDLAGRVGATVYEADEDGTVMTSAYVEQTIRGNLGLSPALDADVDGPQLVDPDAPTRLRP